MLAIGVETGIRAHTDVQVIGFDMGGTSTDVSRYDGSFEHVLESTTAGVTIQAPQLDINTVAAGGGSRLFYSNGVFVVGPESAGVRSTPSITSRSCPPVSHAVHACTPQDQGVANHTCLRCPRAHAATSLPLANSAPLDFAGAQPGPVCYRKGGYLAVTDANAALGRVVPEYFPKIFGPNEDEALDVEGMCRVVLCILALCRNALAFLSSSCWTANQIVRKLSAKHRPLS